MVRFLPVFAVLTLLPLSSTAQVPGSIPTSLHGSRSLFPVRIGDLWGYIDRTGSIRITPQFTSALDFGPNNEPAPAQLGQLWGIIDSDGEWVRRPVGLHMHMYRDLDSSIHYQYFDTTSGEYAFIDTEGRPVIPLWKREGRVKSRDVNSNARRDVSDAIPTAVRELEQDRVSRVSANCYIVTRDKTPSRRLRPTHQVVDSNGVYLLPTWIEGFQWSAFGVYTLSPYKHDRRRKKGAAILDTNGRILYDSNWTSLNLVSPEFIIVGVPDRSGRNWHSEQLGVMSVNGKVLIQPTASDIHFISASDSLFLWTDEQGRMSLRTPSGNEVVAPGDYSSAELVSPDVVRVLYDSEYDFTLIDRTFSGTGIIFSAGSDVNQGFFRDYIDSDTGGRLEIVRLRDTTGAVRFQLDSLAPGPRIVGSDFGEGMVVIRNSGAAYFHNANGQRILGPFADAYGFRDGLAPVGVPNSEGVLRWGYIDPGGNFVVSPVHDTVAAAGRNLLAVAEKKGDRRFWGYVDRTGRWVVPPKFDEARSFRDGRGAVMRYGDSGEVMVVEGCFVVDRRFEPLPYWGFVDARGEVVIPTRYSWVSDFSNGVATAETRGEDDVSGLIDLSGRWRFDSTRFQSVGTFHEGLAPASDQGTIGERTDAGVGYIDAGGNWVYPPRYDIAGPFNNGFAVVSDPRLTADYLYVTLDGEIIWDGRQSARR